MNRHRTPKKRPTAASVNIAACLMTLSLILCAAPAPAADLFHVGYDDGFYLRSEKDPGVELKIGGSLQVDYRRYAETVRADNRFDIRRARVKFGGGVSTWFRFKMEFEFQGNETSNLVDAYGETVFGGSHGLRFGQFKVPFSLEWQTPNNGLWFAERAIGFDLGPKRDLGVMVHGSFLRDRVVYGAGLFNGDGEDGSARGNEEDAPEIAARVAVLPFRHFQWPLLENLQFGGSASRSTIDRTNVNLEVKSTGMVGTNRSLYVLKQNTKFGVLQDVGQRNRSALEAAWAWGPFAAAAEAYRLSYTDLVAAGRAPEDAEFSAWYAAGLWCLTGENPILQKGAFAPIRPSSALNPSEGSWGAFCLAGRIDHFTGDENWITPGAFVSVREADAYTAALTWILHPMHRLILDYTHTEFSDPIRARVLPDGTVDYIIEESVLTFRYSFDF